MKSLNVSSKKVRNFLEISIFTQELSHDRPAMHERVISQQQTMGNPTHEMAQTVQIELVAQVGKGKVTIGLPGGISAKLEVKNAEIRIFTCRVFPNLVYPRKLK
jgi:hypothetical protein